MSAILSQCGTYRYRLHRDIQEAGLRVVFIGVNPSTADAEVEDSTTKKWRGFCLRNEFRSYDAINVFAFRATDVNSLARAPDPVGPDNLAHIMSAIADADVLIPCWGSHTKIPKQLRHHLARMKRTIFESGRPVKVFGFTKDGDPLHPLMLGYDTPLTPWIDCT